MASRQLDEEAIFHIARQLASADARATYLDQVCAGDSPLRERVEALLTIHDGEQEFLRSHAVPAATVEPTAALEAPGQQIGRYKLLQQIGEGGFGVVYMADQVRPVRRKVALKIIKPGMDTKTVVARFEAERQALALMDHANIARVLDGGTTDSGRPYFVMELVRGVPITEYCDQNNLPATERLELLATVCRAVQHAHQKGIIHRDLKPSNVLVTLADGAPVVKVIDFGVSKAINQQLTEKTLFTAYGQLIGTPQYMSPEQAEMTCLDVDTRSDIYSLGVLLYELLTGTTPLEVERLRAAGYADLQRLIRDEEPPRPSTRLSTCGEKLTVIAKHRSATPERLSALVKGELDWIAMKALEKDRSRRYGTANDLADDIERFLSDQPVEACPPSLRYRAQKFIRRNRSFVTAVIGAALILLLGLIGTTTGFIRAWQERNVAERQRESAEEQRRIADEQRQLAEARTAELERALANWRHELIDRGIEAAFRGELTATQSFAEQAFQAGAPKSLVELLDGLAFSFRGEHGPAIEHLRRSRELDPQSIASTAALMMVGHHAGHSPNDYENLRQTLETLSPSEEYAKYDTLFLAWSKAYIDPAQTMDMLQPSIDQHGWMIGRTMLASAQTFVATDRRDRALAAKALANARLAYAALPENVFVRVGLLGCHLTAIELAQHAGDVSMVEDLCRSADEIIESLRGCERHWQVPGTIAEYYELTNNPKAITAWRSVQGDWWMACRAAALSRTEGIERPLADFQADVENWPFAAVARAKLLALSGESKQARAEYERIMASHEHLPAQAFALEILLLLRANDVQAEADRILIAAETEDKGALDNHFSGLPGRLQFLAGRLSAESFLESVKDSRMGQCYAHYLVGLTQLAAGDVAAADESLRLSAATEQAYIPQYYWAKLIRQCISTGQWPYNTQQGDRTDDK